MRPENFPGRKRVRQERALQRRQADLAHWQAGKHPTVSAPSLAAKDGPYIKAKVATAKQEIKTLTDRLGS